MYGVGFLIKKNLSTKIEEFIGVSERLAVLNIYLPTRNGKDEPWTIIQVYAPTESTKQESIQKTEEFYKSLTDTTKQGHRNMIIMGDFNAKVGEQRDGEENAIGKFGYGERNNNGTRLINFALENNITILNSLFKKRPSRKWTWRSPDGKYTNEVDYILSNRPKFFNDVNVINNLNFHTDHRMVRASLRSQCQKKSRKYYHKKDQSSIWSQGISRTNLDKTETDTNTTPTRYDLLISTLKQVPNQKQKHPMKEISTETHNLLEKRRELMKNRKENK